MGIGKIIEFKPKIKWKRECLSCFILSPRLSQTWRHGCPRRSCSLEHTILAWKFSLGLQCAVCLPLFFLWETLKCFLSIHEILIELIRDILEFHVSIFFLINWEACVWILFHALAAGVSGTVLVRVVLWGVTDSISSVPAVVGIVVHPSCLEVLPLVSMSSTTVVKSKMIQYFHFLVIVLWKYLYLWRVSTVFSDIFNFFKICILSFTIAYYSVLSIPIQ